MRAALYVRVSTDDQARDGFSIEAQKRRLVAFAESQDWVISEIYVDDGYSAKDLNRPAIKRLISDLETGKFDIVLVYKLDRLTRSTSDCDFLLRTFDAHNIAFQSCTESYETKTATGRLFIRLIADLAQFERENIAERVRMGMEQKVIEGKKPGGKYPYGYDKKGIQVSEEVAIIRRLRHMYMSDRLSYKKIAVKLNEENILRRGIEWRASTVALTLENPFYAGIIQFGERQSNGAYAQRYRDDKVQVIRSRGDHEAIWTEEEYFEHLSLMKKRKSSGYSRKVEYWFTGLLRCGRCGAAMHGRLTTKRSLKDGRHIRSPYYICNRRKENDICTMPMFRQAHVEHLVMEYIMKLRPSSELIDAQTRMMKNQQASREKAIQKLKRDLEAIKARIKKWQYMFVEDLITSDDLRKRLDEEYANEAQLNAQIDNLKAQEKETPQIQNMLFSMADIWDKMEDDEKKETLTAIFEEIMINTDEEKPKGVKNKFFDASIEVKYR